VSARTSLANKVARISVGTLGECLPTSKPQASFRPVSPQHIVSLPRDLYIATTAAGDIYAPRVMLQNLHGSRETSHASRANLSVRPSTNSQTMIGCNSVNLLVCYDIPTQC